MARPKTPVLGIKLNHTKAVMPKQHSAQAACFDIVAVSREPKGNTCLFETGLSFDIPDGYHVKIAIRSGLSFNEGFSLVNGVAYIDSDYTGPIRVKFFRHTGDNPWPFIGDRIAQAELCRNVKTELVEVTEIAATERGDNGFGSTGK